MEVTILNSQSLAVTDVTDLFSIQTVEQYKLDYPVTSAKALSEYPVTN